MPLLTGGARSASAVSICDNDGCEKLIARTGADEYEN
jgi:hypothetical protein